MNHVPHMIYDLAIILAAAAISTLLFRKLRQPIVLGYLVAGFAVGPHFPLWPTVIDKGGVQLWAEIGVIFLLFGLGLEFSFKKLAKVGKSSSIAAVFELITMSGLGYLFGRAVGWSVMDSVFLGAILSMSSTTIIIRAFGEAGLKGKGFVHLVFGILIVEDLIGILLMVLLAAISIPGSFSGSNLVFLTAKLAFFLLIWFLIGIYILPSLLRKMRSFLTDEILLVVAIALCFCMVLLATKAGFSAALGAFIMGAILAETDQGGRIEHLLVPVRDLFAAVFFVSVGMLIDPAILREHFGIVLMITLLTIVGKLFGSGFGAVLSGRSLKQSVQAGMSLAQIGEFSFILAMLGMNLKVTSDFLYPIIIAVSAVTTFTTPYMIRHSGSVYGWIEARLPQRFLERLVQYEHAMTSGHRESAVGLLWKAHGISVLLNAVVVISIALVGGRYFLPFITGMMGDQSLVRVGACILTLLTCSPFLSAIMLKPPEKFASDDAGRHARLNNMFFGILVMRILVVSGLTMLIINQYSSAPFLSLFVLVAVLLLVFLLRHRVKGFYMTVESHFLENLNAKEMKGALPFAKSPGLRPWNATLDEVVLSSDSKIAGHTLEESKIRTLTGATVVMIDRGRRRIFAPNRSDRLLPNDHVFLIGTDEQLAAAHVLFDAERLDSTLTPDELFSLESIAIHIESDYARRSIREIGIGEEFGGLIVGIERNGQRILNPESAVMLEPGDLIWVFGHRDRIREIKKGKQGRAQYER